MPDQTKMVNFPEREVKVGEQDTPVIVDTEPRAVNSNAPIIKDIKELVKKEEEEGIETEDVYARNVFASDEIEFTTDQADFGTKAKVRIKALVDDGVEGNAITKANFLGSEHADITISDFSAYQVGRFVYLHVKFATESLAPNETLFKIKDAYKPKYETTKCCAKADGTVFGVSFATNGNVVGLTTISASPATNIYLDIYYEV